MSPPSAWSGTPVGSPAYPLPVPGDEIFAGLTGDVVNLFEPCTEAAPVAIALQFLVAFGSAVGHGPHIYVGETKHHMNEYLAIVGTSSRARKGDAKNAALRSLQEAEPAWASDCITSGLSSGEGLIHHVRDPSDLDGGDVGVDDKRLLVVETEFSNPLKQFRRDTNILSNVLRDAWDSKSVLRTLTKNNPLSATDAHISIIAHTTPEDLKTYLSRTEVANGMGNRFMFALVHRVKLLANPPRVPQGALQALVAKLDDALKAGARVGNMRRTKQGNELWEEIYRDLTREEPGLMGHMLARSEAHVLRLSALYALLAHSEVINTDHIRSARAVWAYCEASTRIIFAGMTGNDDAERILAAMRPGESWTSKQLRERVFSNHIEDNDLERALDLLEKQGHIRVEKEKTGGRPRTIIARLPAASRKGAAVA